MAVAVNMRMQWSRMQKYDLWSFHGVILWKINLKLVGLISVKCARSSRDFNNPPLKIVGDFVLETSWGIDLPLDKLFLKPIAGNLTQILASGSGGTSHDLR